MRPLAPQSPVRTQLACRTLSKAREILLEPRKRLFLFVQLILSPFLPSHALVPHIRHIGLLD